jgi:preprotein translocase subunit Sec63
LILLQHTLIVSSGSNAIQGYQLNRCISAGNYYEMLGLETTATEDEIKAAFRRRAKELHPDVNADVSLLKAQKLISRLSQGDAYTEAATAC